MSLGHHIVTHWVVLVPRFELFSVAHSDVNVCLVGSLGIVMFAQTANVSLVASGRVKISRLVLADKQKPGE